MSLVARTVEVTYLQPALLSLLIREIYADSRPARGPRPTTKTVVGDIVPREQARSMVIHKGSSVGRSTLT